MIEIEKYEKFVNSLTTSVTDGLSQDDIRDAWQLIRRARNMWHTLFYYADFHDKEREHCCFRNFDLEKNPDGDDPCFTCHRRFYACKHILPINMFSNAWDGHDAINVEENEEEENKEN